MNMDDVNRDVIKRFRAGEELPGMHRERIVLLTTTGAKTGQPRTTPMMVHRDGARVLVIASNAGAPKDPDWYRNVVADPQVTVELADEKYDAIAKPLDADERGPVWEMLIENYPFFADHQVKAGRTIPVVAITRAE
jgi:deazaflavin-dependent oxidoreductase (nitroreductase family)